MRSTEDTAPSRSEQARLEELWEASRLSYDQARRRQICVEWIAYHERLAGAFLGHVAHHEREQEHYRADPPRHLRHQGRRGNRNLDLGL